MSQNSRMDLVEELESNSVRNGVDIHSSHQDVICLSDVTNVKRHRPIINFDVVSGRYPFMITVMLKKNRFKFKCTKYY